MHNLDILPHDISCAITTDAGECSCSQREKWLKQFFSTPNARQVGGEHYRAANPDLQHWDLVAYNNMDYYTGQLTKYVSRWRKKNGVQDVEKALHYCEKLISLHEQGFRIDFSTIMEKPVYLDEFAEQQKLSILEKGIFARAIMYRDIDDLRVLRGLIECLLREAKAWQKRTS